MRGQGTADPPKIDSEEEVAELWALALKLEGLTRNVGMHAGGVLIAPGKLTDFCPLYAAAGAESVVSQFDKDDVEKAGLVKFDFLGLRTLTILDEAVKLAREVDPSTSTSPRCRWTTAKPMTPYSRAPTPLRCSSSNRAA
jgi:DNA polymerase III alpha subunit